MLCEVCGSKNANRKAKIEKAILTVCNECVKLGEEIPTFIKKETKKEKKLNKQKQKSSITIGDVIEVS